MTDITSLDIKLHGTPIGEITILPNDRSIFSFKKDYIENVNRDTLSLSFKNKYGELNTDFSTTGPNVMPFFSNLLPEGALRDYLAKRAGVKSVRELYLLWALGDDLAGAVTVSPSDGDSWPSNNTEETRQEIQQRKQNALRFSLAGVQLKFSAFNSNNKLTIPTTGIGGSWIVKLPADRYEGVPENEFSCMELARQIGINVPKTELLDIQGIEGIPENFRFHGDKAFAIERFDRSNEGSIHIEDFAQVFNLFPDDKYGKANYKNIANVLGAETSDGDVKEFIRRLVFSTLIGNDDMHLKNWSLIYYDKKRPNLSPAYDLLSTIVYMPSDTAALNYVSTNKMSEFNLRELSRMADKAKLPEKMVLDTAEETVSSFLEVWQKEKANLVFTQETIDVIDNHLLKLQIVKEA